MNLGVEAPGALFSGTLVCRRGIVAFVWPVAVDIQRSRDYRPLRLGGFL